MDSKGGFLGSFLSKGIKTNQLEVNTDEKTLRPIARLKEPRELFALPKEKDYDCAQQAPRWPIECQVIEERVILIPNVPAIPEPYYQRTGNELKPRPVGEENGIIVYNYNPISAVNYDKERQSSNKDNDNNDDDDSSDSDASSCDSRGSTTKLPVSTSITTTKNFANMLNRLESRLSYATKDDDVSDVDDDDEGDDESDNSDMNDEKITEKFNDDNNRVNKEQNQVMASNLDNIWASKSPEYVAVRSLYHSKIQLTKPNTNARTKLKKPSAADCKKLRMIPPMNFNDKLLSKLDLKNVSSSSSSTSTNSDDLTDDGEVDGEEDHIYQVNEQLAIANHPALTTTIQLPNAKSNKILNPNILHPNSTSISNLNHSVPASNAIPLIAILPGETLISDPKVPFVLSRLSRADDNWSNEPSNSAPTTTTTTNNSNNNNSNNSAQDNVGNAQENIKPSHLPQFSRSAANGSKVPTNCHPYNPAEYDGLEFESRFESGNLAKAVQITPTYYELYLRPDLYTSRSKQWFFFRVRRTKRNMIYRFSIVNLVKSNSLYNDGMRPLMYSTTDAKITGVGWKRCGDNICYYCNEDESQISTDEEFDNSSYTLTFNVEFAHDNDIVYFAHSYPYTYSDLQDYLMAIQNDPLKSKFCKLRLLCRTLAGNNVYYLTVTAPTTSDEVYRRKKSIVLSARVHPSETPSSWMMKGVMDFITADTATAKRLRHRFVFKIIPMLNPDGVIVGNTRNSLTGKDLNRQYRTVIRETYPSIWYTKALIKRLIDENGVSMYCDMHAHSRCHNIFIYGCENKRNPEKKLTEQVFPLMLHKNAAEKFSFENCKFKIQRSKEGTGRIVVWMLGITNSYTLEASFGGSTLGSRKGTHFNIMDYEQMGRAFCETLLDYSDDNPIKVKKQAKIIKHIRKIRKREKREQKALKLKKLCDQQCLRLKIIERLLKEGSSAEEPINITLTDYSSDEGSCLSSDEGKSFSDLEGPCCLAIKAPPCTPDIQGDTMRTCDKQRIFKFRRMRKVMKELDRIYFQPLFHKKARFLMKSKRTTCKTKSKRKGKKSDKNHKDFKTNSPHNKHNNNNNNANTDKGKTKIPSFDSGDATTINNGHFANDINAIEYLEDGETSTNNNNESENTTVATDETTMPKQRLKGGRDAKNSSKRKTRIKVSRKLRLWLATRQIIIVRRRTPRKIKLHWKGMRILRTTTKKDDRRILDIPTTDPGSDLIFSTDDEFIVDNSNMSPTYNTLPRIRRNLLQSDLQRRYIEEIGDGFRRMPPELIITSPINELRVKYKLMPEAKLKATNTPGIIIGEGATRRTLSWHNLQTESAAQFTKCKLHSNTLHVLDTKKESLTKEDLNIQLLLKKKTWTGNHITDLNNQNTLDRAKASVRLVTSAKTDSKAITASSQTYHTESLENAGTKMTNNTTQDKSNSTPETDFFARNCSRKLLQWQLTNSSKQNVETTEFRRHRRSPLQTAINDSTEISMTPMFRQIITNNQKAIKNNDKTILENYGNERKTRIKRNFPTKTYGGVKNLLKLTKSKSHTSMLSAIGIDSKGRLPHIRACSSSKLKMSITRIVAIDSKNNSNKISLNRCKNKNNNNSNKKIRKQAPAMQQRTKDNETTINTSKQTSTYKEVATISGAASNSIKQQNYNNNNSNNNNNAFVEGTATTTATQLMRKSKMKVKKRKLPPLLNNSATPINLVNNFDNNL